MIEVTATDLRKDLFRILDRVAKTGEPLRVRGRGRDMILKPEGVQKSVKDMTPEERWARYLARCEAEGPVRGYEDAPTDPDRFSGGWEWDPGKKFADL